MHRLLGVTLPVPSHTGCFCCPLFGQNANLIVVPAPKNRQFAFFLRSAHPLKASLTASGIKRKTRFSLGQLIKHQLALSVGHLLSAQARLCAGITKVGVRSGQAGQGGLSGRGKNAE